MKRTFLVLLTVATVSRAQSFEWSRDFAIDGTAAQDGWSSVVASATFDDGSGAALFVAGGLSAAGHVTADSVAKWDGSAWTAVPSQLSYTSQPAARKAASLAVYDDGTGPALYVGGLFDSIDGVAANSIAKWNGTTWQPLGQGVLGHISTLRALDFGAGSVLCVGTESGAQINGSTTSSIAMWDGSTWSVIGTAVDGNAQAFAVFDEGDGPRLFASGQLLQFPNTVGWSSVARFDGATWSNVGGAVEGVVFALETFDDGSGTALFAGGSFLNLGATPAKSLGKWNGTSWSAVGGGVGVGNSPYDVYDLHIHDDGSGPALFVAGSFDIAGTTPARNVARWNGTTLSALGTPDGVWFEYLTSAFAARAWSLAEFDAGNGPELIVAGTFSRAGDLVVSNIARWDGALWSPLDDPGQELGANSVISVLASYDVGNGPEMLAAGQFDAVGTLPSAGLAGFDGTAWSSFGLGAQRQVLVAESLDDGNGEALYVGGSFDTVDGQSRPLLVKWDGSRWNGMITSYSPTQSSVQTVAMYDAGLGAGPQLHIGGTFKSLDGASRRRIARWDGSAWQSLGSLDAAGAVQALAVHDDGSGSKLYAGGSFLHMEGQLVFGVARWDGVAWAPVGNGFSGSVEQFAVFDDGSGAQLYAIGSFSAAPPYSPVHGIARWNGTAWQPVGNGIGASNVNTLAVFDDGAGEALFIGGGFTSFDGLPLQRLARWNGTSWSSAGDFDATIYALESFDDGSGLGPALYAGGSFATADDRVSVRIAKLQRSCAATSYCTSGVTSNGCVPTISGAGTPSASAGSGFTISVSSVEGQKQGHIFYGITGPIAASWGASSHFLCVKAPTQRTSTQDSGGTAGACNGSIALDWNNYIATHPGSLGVPFSAGTSVWAQLYFRDPPGPKTTALSNGLTFTVCP